MDVTIELHINLVGSERPRSEWFANLLRDAMHEYLESPRVREAERMAKESGILTEAEIGAKRSVATQIALNVYRVTVAPDLGEQLVDAAMTRNPKKK